MEAQRRLESALEAWTEGLMPAINILGNNSIDNETCLTSFHDFATVQHLFFIPQVLSKIKPFLQDESVQSDKLIQLAACYNPTISLSMTPNSSPIPIEPSLSSELEDPAHPGKGWALFNAGNPGHYPLVFLNKQNQSEVAKYICFCTTEEETHLVGTQGKGEAEYATLLHTKAYPSPNFSRCRIKDTDLNIFYPAHISHLLVDMALVNLKDPGVLADVHRLRTYHNSLTCVKRQCLELDKEESHAEAKLLTVEQCLASSAIRTCLQQHLLATCPPSPPTFSLSTHDYWVPHIFAAQGPPNVEGEDSLECHAVLSKWHQGTQLKFPYCLRYSQDSPGHRVEECPLWKTCCWCLSTQHPYDDCPSPHTSCAANRCLVYFGHPNFGSYCLATLAGLLHHELEVLWATSYQDEEWDNANTCYEESDI